MKAWIESERQRLAQKTILAKAIQDGLDRWDALARHASDGRLAIDSNPVARALKTIAVTRKIICSWAAMKTAVERHTYTVIESNKLNGINPHAYLAVVIDKMAKGWPLSRLAEVLPWKWTATIAAEAAATDSKAATAA